MTLVGPTARCQQRQNLAFSQRTARSLHPSRKKEATRRLRLSSTKTHWLSPSLDDDQLCCGNGVFKVLSEDGGAFAIIPYFLISCHSFCQLSCTSLLDAPTNAFCLPRNGSFSLLCQRARKYCCLLSSSTSGCTLDKPLRLLAPSSAVRPQCPL